MKLTLEPTAQIDTVSGVPTRMWTGKTDAGVPVRAWIAIVRPQTADPLKLAAFEMELKALPKHQRQLVAFDIRMAT